MDQHKKLLPLYVLLFQKILHSIKSTLGKSLQNGCSKIGFSRKSFRDSAKFGGFPK